MRLRRQRKEESILESRIKCLLRDIGFKRSSLNNMCFNVKIKANYTDPQIIGDLYHHRKEADLDKFLMLFKKKQRQEYTRVITPLINTSYGTQHLIAIVVEYGSGLYDPIGE